MMTDQTNTDLRRVLIVDDDEAVVTSISHILKHLGVAPIAASDWVEAVEVVTNDPPDVILLDMHMPRVDGAAFLKFIRDEGSHVPVIVVSAFVNDELKKSLIGLKVSAYVAKPFEIADLQREVERALPLPDTPREKQDAPPPDEEIAAAKKPKIKKRRRRRLKNEASENHPIVYVGVGLVCLILTGLIGLLF